MDLPVTMAVEARNGDAGETAARAIAAGVQELGVARVSTGPFT